MARKVFTQKRQSYGLGAPQNSLELPVETSQSYSAVGDYIPYSHEIRREWFDPTDTSVKRLINEQIPIGPSSRPTSVVARLMGMDMLPDAKSASQEADQLEINFPIKKWNRKGSTGHMHCNSNYLQEEKFGSFQFNKDSDPTDQYAGMKLKKPKPREHPQEEELKKFKKEFVEWQEARFRACSKAVELGEIPNKWLAQETLKKEKTALYTNSRRITVSEKPLELKDHAAELLSPEGGGLLNHTYRKELFAPKQNESYSSSCGNISREFHQSSLIKSSKKLDVPSAPTKIVILRPGLEHMSDNEESPVSLYGTSEERGSIDDFLEQVKERLRRELEGNPKRGTMVRGGGIETPFSEKPSYPKQIAQCIAKQVRESVTQDFGTNRLRSESTNSYKSTFQFDGAGCSEFVNKDSRRLLPEKLRNVIKRGTSMDIPTVSYGTSNSSMLDNENGIVENEPEMQTRSFRHVRSKSAPVSGMSFGKLLLEDRNILTGGHIWRKHEAIEDPPLDVRKSKKERFNFKGRVSSLKYNFTLGGRLFGRKIQLAEQSCNHDWNFLKDITSGPTPEMIFGRRHENPTEVPPSPASICSSVHEQLWESMDHLSTPSPADVSPLEADTVHLVFKEISSNLNELRRQLNELDAKGPNNTVTGAQPSGAEMEIEDEAEAYIRDVLVASGMFNDSSAKLVSNRIFEEVEESYMKKFNDSESSRRDQRENANHKLLFDLLNETLSTVLSPPVPMSRFRNKVIGSTPQVPNGKKLFDCVWEIVHGHLCPSTAMTDDSLDNMMNRDFMSVPWYGLINDDIDALGKEMELWITRELIEEIVTDMKP